MDEQKDTTPQNSFDIDVAAVVAEGKKRNKNKKKRAIVGIVVMCILAGVGLFLMLRGVSAKRINLLGSDIVKLKTGDTQRLSYEILPENTTDQSVFWTTSDASVATVDDMGNVTAVGEGDAVITVTTKDGKSDICAVSVKLRAFEFLKKLGTEEYVQYYRIDNGNEFGLSIQYDNEDNNVWLFYFTDISVVTLTIPESLSGEFDGLLEFDYKNGKSKVTSLYEIDAAQYTSDTHLKSYSCDDESFYQGLNDDIYNADLSSLLIVLYEDVLEPNGYTYADIGFTSYN